MSDPAAKGLVQPVPRRAQQRRQPAARGRIQRRYARSVSDGTHVFGGASYRLAGACGKSESEDSRAPSGKETEDLGHFVRVSTNRLHSTRTSLIVPPVSGEPQLKLTMKLSPVLSRGALALTVGLVAIPAAAAVEGWLAWRGPEQSGVSRETGLPEKIGSKEEALWVADWGGQSTAVISTTAAS